MLRRLLHLHPFIWGWAFGGLMNIVAGVVKFPWWASITMGLGIGFFAAWMWPQEEPEHDE